MSEMSLIVIAGDGMKSEKKQKKKQRKRRLEAEEDEAVVSKEVCGDAEDTKTQHLAVKHSQETPKNTATGRQHLLMYLL